MKARTKFLVGGVLVLGTAAYLMVSSIKATGQYYLTPTELSAKLASDSSFRRVGVKIGARVVPGTIERIWRTRIPLPGDRWRAHRAHRL